VDRPCEITLLVYFARACATCVTTSWTGYINCRPSHRHLSEVRGDDFGQCSGLSSVSPNCSLHIIRGALWVSAFPSGAWCISRQFLRLFYSWEPLSSRRSIFAHSNSATGIQPTDKMVHAVFVQSARFIHLLYNIIPDSVIVHRVYQIVIDVTVVGDLKNNRFSGSLYCCLQNTCIILQ